MVIGKVSPFNPTQDDFEAWIEVLDGYFLANDIDKQKSPEKAVAVLISTIGLPTYSLLKNLLAPHDSTKEKFTDLGKVLKTHF